MCLKCVVRLCEVTPEGADRFVDVIHSSFGFVPGNSFCISRYLPRFVEKIARAKKNVHSRNIISKAIIQYYTVSV